MRRQEADAVKVSSFVSKPEMATRMAPPPGLRLRARLPRKSLQPRLKSQFQLKQHTPSVTATGGGCTRGHVTRPQCADERARVIGSRGAKP